ncbi:unnamed protein product [Candidula unifasciata]|uniref:AB hydrolase-1 domain-containing protein n=1 Tax=Candidula unifasciata TaxID=100452 RepID=A0A8S3ZW93_9EUPU|nr:unnamed protein product [Candidula unifasciata]
MIKALKQKAVFWCMAIYYGILVIYELLREGIKTGIKAFQVKPLPRPSCLDDPTLGTHNYLHLEDVTIHYVASGPEDKPLMLFVHGFPEFWYSWRYQIREFQKDYRVVAIDQRGYGDSDKPSGIDEYSVKKLVSDIKHVILALGYENCILVGHDWGGLVVWAFGRQYPDMVSRLIVMNVPPSPVFQKLLHKNKEQLKRSWYMFLFQLPYLPEIYLRFNNFEAIDFLFAGSHKRKHAFSNGMQNPMSQEDANAYKYIFSQPGAVTPPINYYRAALSRPNGNIAYDMEYTMPVLLIWGYHDIALTPVIPDMVEKENPKITVRRIPEAGHFVQMDTPIVVNKVMREWLNETKTA